MCQPLMKSWDVSKLGGVEKPTGHACVPPEGNTRKYSKVSRRRE